MKVKSLIERSLDRDKDHKTNNHKNFNQTGPRNIFVSGPQVDDKKLTLPATKRFLLLNFDYDF